MTLKLNSTFNQFLLEINLHLFFSRNKLPSKYLEINAIQTRPILARPSPRLVSNAALRPRPAVNPASHPRPSTSPGVPGAAGISAEARMALVLAALGGLRLPPGAEAVDGGRGEAVLAEVPAAAAAAAPVYGRGRRVGAARGRGGEGGGGRPVVAGGGDAGAPGRPWGAGLGVVLVAALAALAAQVGRVAHRGVGAAAGVAPRHPGARGGVRAGGARGPRPAC